MPIDQASIPASTPRPPRPDPFALTYHHTTVEGHPTRYAVCGAGDPLVLVHGLSGSWLWWARNLRALSSRYQVYLLDLPGFGTQGGLGRPRFALDQTTHWLAEWMKSARVPRAHFAGHSMGGYITLHLAAHRPELVRRLVLAAPAVFPMRRSLFSEVTPLVTALRRAAPSFLPILALDALRAGPLNLLRAATALLRADLHDQLRHVSAPTLLIWGQRDVLVPPAVGEHLRDELPDARLLAIPNAGHVVMYDRPRAFDEAALGFLAGQPVGVEKR
ncbi:MAG TPA: alpha/beta fold hydrolase [Ktedonobacterales bacterium]|nr:alpha/beta fold hydrolase [Ktedonobacterales bacterium]